MHRITWQIILTLSLAFVIRFGLSLTIYNNDVHNHISWMESVSNSGWQGLYERDVSPWAPVNYPPLSLYSFWVGEQIWEHLPLSLQSIQVHTALYKLPSIITDCLIALLIWIASPFTQKWRAILMFIYLFNPALMVNSVFWGQLESFGALFSIITIILLIRGRSEVAIITTTLGLLVKQNILPLIPLIFIGLVTAKTNILKILSALILSLGIVVVLYSPLTPADQQVLPYALSSYLSSVGGQTHQHLSSVNALNFWYSMGLNQVPDHSVRVVSLLILGVGVVAGIVWFTRLTKTPYISYWVATFIISIWTFVFSTRMHERHSYMSLAYLIFLLPYGHWRWVYLTLSVISFYNTYAVWMEYFASPMPLSWLHAMSILSMFATLISLIALYLPAQFLHQNRIKPQVVDRG